MPAHYLERNEHLDRIIDLLLQGSGRNIGITGIASAVGLQGMGGIGKSILAAAVAWNDRIRTAFADGIAWTTLGQTPDIVNIQAGVLAHFDAGEFTLEDPQDGKESLNRVLAGQKVLLILDDVWDIRHLEYFDVSAATSRLLITTRHAQVLYGIGAEEYKIGVLSNEQAIDLLRSQARWQEDGLPAEAREIIAECGALPLALSMIGAMLRSKPRNRWQRVLRHLQDAELRKIRQRFINYPYPDLFKALHVSVAALSPLMQERYPELAIFPEDVPIPESVLDIYWNEEDLDHHETLDIIDELVDASLLFRYDDESLTLHDLQRDYLQSECGNLPRCHRKLIDAYAKAYPDGWGAIPYEPPWYFHNHFVDHLKKSGDRHRSREIADALLKDQPFLPWQTALTCAELLDKTPPQIARQLIGTNTNPFTLVDCIKTLGKEAKEDARRLLREHQHPQVITACLQLLGQEAKDDARRLVREHQDPLVIAACLQLLGQEAKEGARRLLREHQAPEVITACLRLLGQEAKEGARRLVREHQDHQVITACLKLLGEEAKEDARRLVREHQAPEVITACLQLLGKEAKDEARRLVRKHQNHRVITACLKLLGEEAKGDAWRLLREHQDPRVITVCLRLLGEEAKEDAWRLLREKPFAEISANVFFACLSVSGEEGIRFVDKQDRRIRQRKALELLSRWHLFSRPLVTDALNVFNDDPKRVTTFCRQILAQWERELASRNQEMLPAYAGHVIKAMSHPEVQTSAKWTASRMLQKGQDQPGLLDDDLLRQARDIVAGRGPSWRDCRV